MARVSERDTVSAAAQNRTVVELADDFTISPSDIIAYPGAIIEVRNTGLMEHHFVVAEWTVNVTVSPGTSSLVQVPAHMEPGDSFEVRCTIPGHSASGMSSKILIDVPPDGAKIPTLQQTGASTRSTVAGMDPFLPPASVVGADWTQLRTGKASSVIAADTDFNIKVCPGEGIGAAYVGPSGSRATVMVMPLQTQTWPPNQVRQAIDSVQLALTKSWATDQLSSVSLQRIDPPMGCDIAYHSSGIVPLLTLPAGSTVCQIRNAGVAIFVTVEGEINELNGVEAADALISRVLSGE